MTPLLTKVNTTRQHAELNRGHRRQLGTVGDFLVVVPPYYLYIPIKFLVCIYCLPWVRRSEWCFRGVIKQLCNIFIIWTAMGCLKQLCPSPENSKVIESNLLLAEEIGKEERSEELPVFSIRSTDVFSVHLHN